MIAMPVKTNREDSAISPVFGKVKYFAIVSESGDIEFVENIEKSGMKAVQLLISKGAKTLLMSHIGERPFQYAKSFGMEIYYVGKERVTIRDAVEKFKSGEYKDASTIELSLFSSHGKGEHHHH